MEIGCLLLQTYQKQQQQLRSIFTPPWSSSSCPLSNYTTTTTNTFFFPHSHFLKIPSYIRFLYTTETRSCRWDSIAETVRTPRFEDDDDENDDDFPSGMDQGSAGLLNEITDNIYIFKVFRSFGWMLPAIISSMLLATGPKAFLLALALPLGQSALSLAFDKLVGQTQKSRKRKRRTKKKPFASPKSGAKMGQDQEASGSARKGNMDYQSWVARNAGSVEKGTQNAPSFSGWDELG